MRTNTGYPNESFMGSSLGLDTGESDQEHRVQMNPFREVSFCDTVALKEAVTCPR